eukprot:jgi/Astpho2/7103/Aster-08443
MGRLGFIVFVHAIFAVRFGPKFGELYGINISSSPQHLDASLLSMTILVKSVALITGVLGNSIGRVLLDTCNGQSYNSSQYFCLVLPGNIGNYNTGTNNHGDNNSGTNLVGRNLSGTGLYTTTPAPTSTEKPASTTPAPTKPSRQLLHEASAFICSQDLTSRPVYAC